MKLMSDFFSNIYLMWAIEFSVSKAPENVSYVTIETQTETYVFI